MVSGSRIPYCASCELKEVKSSQLLQQLLLCVVRKEDHRMSSIYQQAPPFLHHMLHVAVHLEQLSLSKSAYCYVRNRFESPLPGALTAHHRQSLGPTRDSRYLYTHL